MFQDTTKWGVVPVTGSAVVSNSRVRLRIRTPGRVQLGVSGIGAFLLAWEFAPRSGVADSRVITPFTDVVLKLGESARTATFWTAILDTMVAWGIGLAIALIAGTVAGAVLGSSPLLRRYTNSTIEFFRPIPSVALIPIVVLLYGVTLESTLVLVVYGSVWPVLIQAIYGVGDIDKVALDTAKGYGFKRFDVYRWVVFPTALPFLLTGARLASVFALLLTITAGLVIGTPGLGVEIARAQAGGAIPYMYALILTTGLIGVTLNIAFRVLERKLLSWHPSIRKDQVT